VDILANQLNIDRVNLVEKDLHRYLDGAVLFLGTILYGNYTE